MSALINLKKGELELLFRIFEKLSQGRDHGALREEIAEDLLRLLNSDYFASYIWNQDKEIFEHVVFVNMSLENIEKHQDYYQFCDPITRPLQQFRNATPVCTVIPQEKLEKTEYFNDFLMADGLHHGINLYAYDDELNIGDLRIWRAANRPAFDKRDVALLDIILPHFRNALRNARAIFGVKGSVSSCGDLFENAKNAIFVFSQKNRLIYRNRRAREIETELSPDRYASFLDSVERIARLDFARSSWGPFNLSVVQGIPATGSENGVMVIAVDSTVGGAGAEGIRENYGLSPREAEICLLLCKGLIDREIASILQIAPSTVRTHLKSIFRKLDITNRTELVYTLLGE